MQRRLLYVLFPVIVGGILLAVIAFGISRQQLMGGVSEGTRLYMSVLAKDLNIVEKHVKWLVLYGDSIDELEAEKNPYLYKLEKDVLCREINAVTDSISIHGEFFLYLPNAGRFENISPIDDYKDYLAKKTFLISRFSRKSDIYPYGKWFVARLRGKAFLVLTEKFHGHMIGTFFELSKIIDPFRGGFKEDNIVSLLMPETGKVLYSTEPEIADGQHKFQSDILIDAKDYGMPFSIGIYVFYYHSLVLFSLVRTAISILLTLLPAIYTFVFMKREVVDPVETFTDQLGKITKEEELLGLADSRIQELTVTTNLFENLVHQVHELKLDVYKRELAEQKFQIKFLQDQIKPHFYLNCLTTINSMAQVGKYEDVKKMVMFTSRYLRYLFQSDKEKLTVREEAGHVKDYLDIQLLRFGEVLEYDCSIQAGTEEALVPSLFLITFIENCIKHGFDIDGTKKLKILLQIEKCQDDLLIRIEDNGKGFSEALLAEKDKGNIDFQDGRPHVGIHNSIQRLSYLYGERYRIRFYNKDDGGAVIDVRLPYERI